MYSPLSSEVKAHCSEAGINPVGLSGAEDEYNPTASKPNRLRTSRYLTMFVILPMVGQKWDRVSSCEVFQENRQYLPKPLRPST